MKRFRPMIFTLWILLGCTVTTPIAALSPSAPTGTQIPPATLETGGATSAPEHTGEPMETPPADQVKVFVFFTLANDEQMTPAPVARVVPNSGDLTVVIHSTLKELLKGPNETEKAQGLISWFSPATEHSAAGVVLEGDSDLTVDFIGLNTLIPNASTSAGSQMLLSQLNSTMFQFESVQTVHYTLDGDCAAFWEWLQFGCHPVTRADWEKG